MQFILVVPIGIVESLIAGVFHRQVESIMFTEKKKAIHIKDLNLRYHEIELLWQA